MKRKSASLPFDMPELEEPTFPDLVVDLIACGGCDDGRTMNTEAFERAITKCAGEGGGTVQVGPGIWLTGPIHLRSNVRLHVAADAVVRFSSKPSDYLPVVFTRWEGIEGYNYSPFIYAKGCTNIAVTGSGVFDGQGSDWWHWKKLQYAAAKRLYNAEHDGIGVDKRIFGREEDALRPQFIQPIQCEKVLIEGVTFKNGPQWTIHPVYCENVIIRKVTVLSEGPNTDGLNPDSCRNVLVENCRFSTGDDCIAINSGMNEDGWRVNKPSENILIRNCRFENGHGGLVIGSAMSGGVRNVYAHDCTCLGTDVGVRLKSRRGRSGTVENIYIGGFTMSNIRMDAVRINMFYGATTVLPRSEHTPTFRNIELRNIFCEGAGRAVFMYGLPEQPLENIVLEDLTIRSEAGIICNYVQGLRLARVTVEAQNGPALSYDNVQGLQMTDIKTKTHSFEEPIL